MTYDIHTLTDIYVKKEDCNDIINMLKGYMNVLGYINDQGNYCSIFLITTTSDADNIQYYTVVNTCMQIVRLVAIELL